MRKRVFIIHGWGGNPEEGWFPWLKKELEKKEFDVKIPAMPNPDEPKIDEWVSFLKENVGEVNEDMYFVGHSMGCQAILRYLESLPSDAKIGGAVLVAGFVHLTQEAYEEEGDEEIAKPWIGTPIDWGKILIHTKNFVTIFSDNDPFIPIADAKIFEEKLRAKIVIEHNKNHFSGSDGVTELPVVLYELMKIIKRN